MLIKILKILFLAILLICIQIAAVPNLPSVFSNLNVFLTTLIFISVVFKFSSGIGYGLIWAVVLDLYSPYPFGAYLAITMLTLFVVYEIFSHFLTNKSYYSLLVLTLIATLIFNIFNLLFIESKLFVETKDYILMQQAGLAFLQNFAWQIGLNMLLASVLFFFLQQFSKRFNAVFIDTTKN